MRGAISVGRMRGMLGFRGRTNAGRLIKRRGVLRAPYRVSYVGARRPPGLPRLFTARSTLGGRYAQMRRGRYQRYVYAGPKVRIRSAGLRSLRRKKL